MNVCVSDVANFLFLQSNIFLMLIGSVRWCLNFLFWCLNKFLSLKKKSGKKSYFWQPQTSGVVVIRSWATLYEAFLNTFTGLMMFVFLYRTNKHCLRLGMFIYKMQNSRVKETISYPKIHIDSKSAFIIVKLIANIDNYVIESSQVHVDQI